MAVSKPPNNKYNYITDYKYNLLKSNITNETLNPFRKSPLFKEVSGKPNYIIFQEILNNQNFMLLPRIFLNYPSETNSHVNNGSSIINIFYHIKYNINSLRNIKDIIINILESNKREMTSIVFDNYNDFDIIKETFLIPVKDLKETLNETFKKHKNNKENKNSTSFSEAASKVLNKENKQNKKKKPFV